MAVSAATFEQFALEADPEKWELVCGRVRRKPDDMSFVHNLSMRRLGYQLQQQLPLDVWIVAQNSGHAKRDDDHYFIPDVAIYPVAYIREHTGEYTLETYPIPLPLVVEIWSRSTGGYDVDTKFPIYKERGDLEIWRLHPYQRDLIAWRRQADGSYRETYYDGGVVPVESLPGVVVNLDDLWL